MNALVTYIVAAIVSLGVFYAAYIVFLRKEPLFRFNRVYLLSSLLLSYLIPLIILLPDSFSMIIIKTPGSGLINSFTLSPVVISATANRMPALPGLIGLIYLIGLVYFAVRLIIRLLSIYKLSKNGDRSDKIESSIIWSHSNIPPFSFFRTMYLPADLKDTLHLNEVIRHEQIHINSFHSFDIMLTQVLQILCWINPFIPLTEKALREIHEFEADKAVIKAGTDPVAYTKILFSQDKTALALVLGNNFNYSLIKRRLTMFYKKNTRYARLKAIVVLPMVLCIVMLYAIGCQQSANKSSTAVEKDSALALVKETPAVQATDSTIPPPPPPPPPPPTPPSKTSVTQPPPPPPPPPIGTKDANGVYTVVDKMPQFPGGEEARVKYMVNNVKYPMSAKDKGVQGMVIVSFVVEKDGSINEVKVIKGIEKSCDEESLRIIKGMPNWKPGSQKGKIVRVRFTMPIMFKLA